MLLSDFDFDLPAALIAEHPLAARSASRLLHLDGETGALHDRAFVELPGLVRPGDVMVFNDTRVVKARLLGHKHSGGKLEVLIERVIAPDRALAQIRASKTPREGQPLWLDGGVMAIVEGREEPFFRLRFEACNDLYALLEQHGRLPLPPYIRHAPDDTDAARYQTVYAREPGAVAAPTAGLHFDLELLECLRMQNVKLAWVTLHVGAGTFKPVHEADVTRHVMHSERFHIPADTVTAIEAAHRNGGRVVAVGTTSLRALEAAASGGVLTAGPGETNLFILPGYQLRVVDRLITNFHLPRSTLLMLVAAFGGLEHMRHAYRHAIEQRYRFFSYGDAMLIERSHRGQCAA